MLFRVKVYEALVKGKTISTAGIPESFRVLIKEFQALGLNVEMLDYEDKIHDLRELEAQEEEEKEVVTVDEIDPVTGEVKPKESIIPEIIDPPREDDTPIEDLEDEEDDDYEDEDEEPDFDELEDIEAGFEGEDE